MQHWRRIRPPTASVSYPPLALASRREEKGQLADRDMARTLRMNDELQYLKAQSELYRIRINSMQIAKGIIMV